MQVTEIRPMAQGGMVKRSNLIKQKQTNIENCFDIQTTKIQFKKWGRPKVQMRLKIKSYPYLSNKAVGCSVGGGAAI